MRRHELRLADWLAIAAQLRDTGKEGVLSTQVLHESGADAGTMHRVTTNGAFMVEANDRGAVRQLAGNLQFVAGPHLNLYNLPSLQWMASLGASRWVMPLEMRRDDLAVLRLSPQAHHMPEVLAVFDAVRCNVLDGAAAQARLLPLMPEQPCNGYWHGRAGLDQIVTDMPDVAQAAQQLQKQEWAHGAR